MSLFNFTSMLSVLLLFVCTCSYIHRKVGPYRFGDPKTQGLSGIWWKAARVGERLSPWVAAGCLAMAVHTLVF